MYGTAGVFINDTGDGSKSYITNMRWIAACEEIMDDVIGRWWTLEHNLHHAATVIPIIVRYGGHRINMMVCCVIIQIKKGERQGW